jgi:eukaryotic-like serine/threonine-protein kinase
MSDVYLAATDDRKVDFTKLVVIKKLREEYVEDSEFVTMFLDEARIAARLNHPNVIQTLEVGQENEDYFLAMEYLDGQPFSRILTRSAFGMPLGMHLSVIADALNGLHYAHELKEYDGTTLNVVHRDVTPHNIFVTYTGQVKVMDFGIAKAAGRIAETRVGMIKGKVAYMAPEQVSLRPVDRRTDVFAAGVAIYEAATRERMWKGLPEQEVLKRLIGGKHPTSPRAKRPEVNEALDKICQRALAFDPEARYPTAAALQEDLEAYTAEHETRPTPRQLGDFVSKLFSEQQEQIRKVIQAQLTDLLDSRRSMVKIEVDYEDAELGQFSGRESVPASQVTPSQVTPSQVTPSAVIQSEPPLVTATRMSMGTRPQPSKRQVALAAAALVALGVLASSAWRTVTQADGPAMRTGSADDVTLTLRATPKEAHFTIDEGPSLENPCTGWVPRDTKAHRIRAEAPGFVGETQETHFDRDVSIRFALGPASD